ncbi:MAG: NAD(P)H-hydrate dehydratase [Methanomassiliicoccaceae archaeon]|nr:NAD(P)H-hydrate dehydratase [Methanomassiliicoccaceae archaeon]
MITSFDSAVIDANCEAMGIGVPVLMANAGKAIASVLKERFPDKRIAFVCGSGNNGGDGMSAAKTMDAERVTVYLLKPKGSIRSDLVRGVLSELMCQVKDFSEFDENEHDVIVDCALGTGASGDVRPPYDEFIRTANRFRGSVVSADIPSGLGTPTAIIPDITITLHDIKKGMDRENSGEIIVKDIGIPKEAYDNVGPGDMLRYPIPLDDSHKGSNGRLLIIGGGPYYGAPAMSALAAMRIGVDTVRLAVPENCSHLIASFSPVLMISTLSGNSIRTDHVDYLLELSKQCDAVLIGPGLGVYDATMKTVRQFVQECTVPVVVDADGLTALGQDFVSSGETILTPHGKEFERLCGGTRSSADSVKELAKKMDSVILLTGKTDVISDGDKLRYNNTGCSGMTSAGTGDVLSGIVAGLLSKGMTCFEAAALGAFVSGRAGEHAFEEKSYGMTAMDVIEDIPKVLKEYIR